MATQRGKQSAEHIAKRAASAAKTRKARGKLPSHNALSTDTYKEKLMIKWPDIPYDISDLVYEPNKKVVVVCRTHGEFEKWPSDLLNKSGCPKCSGNSRDPQFHIDALANKYPDLDFSKFVYVNALSSSTVICKKHGELFPQEKTNERIRLAI